jgi:hypothetical protein
VNKGGAAGNIACPPKNKGGAAKNISCAAIHNGGHPNNNAEHPEKNAGAAANKGGAARNNGCPPKKNAGRCLWVIAGYERQERRFPWNSQ